MPGPISQSKPAWWSIVFGGTEKTISEYIYIILYILNLQRLYETIEINWVASNRGERKPNHSDVAGHCLQLHVKRKDTSGESILSPT
jgi:hypothetical protein